MDRPAETTSNETLAIPQPGPAPKSTAKPSLTHTEIPEEGRFVAGTLLAGRYRIVGLLGKGGMGEVYRATDLALGQSVALKFLPAIAAENPLFVERFHGEVRVARQVSHPNVCRVFDIGEADGMPFISMEYVDGEDLSCLLLRIGRLPSDKAIDTARRICAGLAAAHSKGVIHRDLKPHNIMMNRRGEIVIMDFGLAAIAGQLSGPEARNGTPAYMSPEQLKGTEVTSRSDIYALGLVLYELFTGKRPFEAKTIRQLIALQEAGQIAGMSSLAADIDPAIDNIVRRCLDPDPAKRPENPLAVSVALPGGDPLAAALAAGETPSPELVAASGETAGMAPKYAFACLGVVLLCLGAAPWLKQQKIAFYRTPLDYPPEVLRQKARDIADSFGYSRKPADTSIPLFQRLELIGYLDLKPAPRDWKTWLASEAPVTAFYREAPAPMLARPVGDMESQNPPLTQPGMVSMDLDAAGRLRAFDAVPYQAVPHQSDAIAGTPVDAVFRAAQLDIATFTEIPPVAIPRTPADQRRAWRGPHPALPGTELTVEIGQWQGRVTHFRVFWPWDRAAAGQVRNPLMSQIRAVLDPALGCVGLCFGIFLARRNWKLGRGDRRGAFTLAIVVFLLRMLMWAGAVHPVPTLGMTGLFFGAVSDATFAGVLVLILYLAAEPALRARWPHSVITWNRLLAGRWYDAQVGSHVLIGAAFGFALWLLLELRLVFFVPRYGLDTVGGLYLLYGTRQWFGGMFSRAEEALRLGLVLFFVLFGLRTLFRRDWIAAILGAVLFSLLEGDLSNSLDLPSELAVYIVLFTILIGVLLRVGLVASVSVVFFLNAINGVTLGTDWTTWYTPTGLATSALILGLALLAFRQSLGTAPAPC